MTMSMQAKQSLIDWPSFAYREMNDKYSVRKWIGQPSQERMLDMMTIDEVKMDADMKENESGHPHRRPCRESRSQFHCFAIFH